MIYVGSAQPFEAVFESGTTGLVGTVQVAIIDNDGVTVTGPTTTNITENIVGGDATGVYTWNAPAAPGTLGQYTIVWSPDATFDPEVVSVEDLVVVTAAAGPLPPIPPPDEGGLPVGPCSAWTTSDAAAACCNAELGTDTSPLDDYVYAASELLFQYSGRIYSGLCEKTVRPPCRPGCGCGYQVLSRGYVVPGPWWDWWAVTEGPCQPSRVLLSGYPVRQITEVKIDGSLLASTEYGLLDYRWLVRKNDEWWPRCQDLSLDDTEEGTWSVTYTYGQPAPISGQLAAAELACEMYKACVAGTGECALPTGVTRLVRQGVVIEKLAFTAWGLQQGIWRTGLTRVDAFLNWANPKGIQRRATIWSPASHLQYARRALT